MDNDMSDIIKKISDMLNNNNNNTDNSQNSSFENSEASANNNIDINTILKMQEIVKAMNSESQSSRSNLLRSLKPYLKPSRQEKVDQYIQLLNMENVFKLFNNNDNKS